MTPLLRLLPLLLALAAADITRPNTCGDDLPRVVIGCWQVLERHSDKESAVATLRSYVDAGFLAFDTADIYGSSEAILGELRSRASDRIVVHSKYVTSSATLHEARRVNEKSRRSLGAPPDLVAFHWWDYGDAGFVKAARHLVTLQAEGNLGRVAACNFDVEHLSALIEGGVSIVSNQVQYSLLDRRPENGMLQFARARGIRLAAFGVVAGGWLSDRWLGAPPPGHEALTTVSMRMYKARLDEWSRGQWALFQELLTVLRSVADKHHTTVANVAAAWVLRRLGPDGGWVILGVRDTSHLEEHRALLNGAVSLDDADEARVQAVLDRGAKPRGDIWSHERGLV